MRCARSSRVESSRVAMRCDRNARGDKHKSTQPTASLKCQQGSQSQLASRVARAILAETALPTKTTRCGVLCVVQPELVWLEAFTQRVKAPGPVASLQMRPPTREPPKNERLGAHPSIPQAQPHHPPPAVHRAPPAPVTPCPTKPRTVPCPRVGRRGGAHSQLIVEVNPASTLTASISFVGGGRASGRCGIAVV